MSTTTTTTTFRRRELAHRVSDGIEVAIDWDKVRDTLSLEVHDATSDEPFELEILRDRALDAFRHPFAYIAAAEAIPAGELLAA